MSPFAILATKNRRDRRGGFSHVRVLGFSHKEQERQERSRERRNKRGLGGVGLWLQTIFKKFVIGCHWVHTFTWLNLLLEPKRLLQRFGFVFLGYVAFCDFGHKEQEKQKGRVLPCLRVSGFSHKDQERQERWKDMFEGAFLSPLRKKLKIFCHRCHRCAYNHLAGLIKLGGLRTSQG